MESDDSLPHLQVADTGPHPEPDKSSPCPNPISWKSTLILTTHLRLRLPSGLSFSPQVSQQKPSIHLSSPPIHATCSTHLILLDLLTQIISG